MTLDKLLLRLLENMELIGQHNEELFDSEVRERMGNAIMNGFVRAKAGYQVPQDLGMFSDEANYAVRSAIQSYVDEASSAAASLGIVKFHDRLAAFQNREVRTEQTKSDYDEFFGHTPPEFYNEHGVVMRLQ